MLNWIKPYLLALGICSTFWFLLIISATHSLIEEHLFTKAEYRLFSIYLHLTCICSLCIIISFLTHRIFYKNDFNSWFSTLGFFLYILIELIMIVNALTMEFHSKTKFCIESLVVFVLLFLFTYLVSWEFNIYNNKQRILQEEYINRQISFKLIRQGVCVTIPLRPATTSRK
ncbi:hypothetical protein ABEB36_005924 [Hypothenemus hampei]|uniref:Uncharacterized protein n=1 Tax=Hypothenemus hampei TaxID=57062 RepID=A0ABD1F0B0_HYPHA